MRKFQKRISRARKHRRRQKIEGEALKSVKINFGCHFWEAAIFLMLIGAFEFFGDHFNRKKFRK